MTRIYVASRVRHAHAWRRDRDVFGVPILSTWIDEDGPGQTADIGELWERIAREVAACDALVFYATRGDLPLKGALVEAGMAIALGKPVYAAIDGSIEMEPDSLRPIGSWLRHPLVTIVSHPFQGYTLACGPIPGLRATNEGGAA